MKTTFLTTLLALMLLAGCDDGEAVEQSRNTETGAVTETIRQTGDAVREKGAEAIDSIANTVEEQKEVVGSAERLLSSVGSKLDQWKAVAAEKGDALKAESAEALKQLDEKKSALTAKLQSLRNESAETWQDVKPDLQAAVDDLKRAYDKVADRFMEEDPPGETLGD